MIFNTKLLEAGLNARFDEQYRTMQERPHLAAISSLFTEVPSNKSQEDYGWLGDVPSLREWIGDKSVAALNDYKYTIRNRDFYAGFAIDRNELEDEQISAIMPRVDMLSMRASQFPADLILELITNGETGLAYDGAAFFSNRTAPNDNLLAGTGTTLAQIKADIQTARANMMRFESDQGKAMGLMLDTLLVPPELEATFLEAVGTPNLITTGQGAQINPIANWISRVITVPELTDSTDWYGFATGFPLRPFVFQTRKNPIPVLDDTQEKRNRKLEYTVEMRGNAGYGFWQMAVKVVNGS